ncbi:hypothetical protein MC7420_5462 [Coleofasciculus chthonoplastes PCC 7420]|uniref:Uncharacterized protein n=1 Tax=Coleofasciculus chthonoplastes PCC 7420 TaxID=118168 RepID=B4VPW3_9CYAN|nr:hypothetical protein MC7420_5462 [Coleofasciculus chthonoplastes PCC 7420]
MSINTGSLTQVNLLKTRIRLSELDTMSSFILNWGWVLTLIDQ